jgi:molybdate transport system permease protein
MNRGPGVGLATIATIAASFLALPVIVLVARAFISEELAGALASPVVIDALVLSLITTASSLVVVVVFGLPLAIYLARTSGGRFKVWLETAVDLPIVLPPSVAGLALLLVFGSRGLIGQSLSAFGLSIPFTTFAVVLAQVFVAAPFFIRSARAGISGVENDLEDAARVDGATERHVLRWITVPLAAPALAAGLVMTWARALGEFGATIMFAGNIQGRTQTLPLVVYGEFQSSDLEASIAAATVLVLAASVALVAVRYLNWGRALDARAGG